MTMALRISPWVRYPLIGLFVAFAVLPLLYILRVAAAGPGNVESGTPRWRAGVTFENFERALSDAAFRRALLVSLLVGAVSTAIVMLVATPAAFVCATIAFRGRRNVEFWILSTRMLPPVVVLVPSFLVFRTFDLLDTTVALIVMHTVVSLSLAFFMARSFFADLPQEILEAADVDGASRKRTFATVALPQVRSGLMAAAVLVFIFSWNELVFSVTVAGGQTKTGPVAMFGFVAFQDVQVGPLMAAATVLMLPVAVLLILMQRGLIRGLTLGAVKG